MKTALDKIINEVNKKFGDGTVYKGSEIVEKKEKASNGITRIKTGSLSLDLITNGGWPLGRISEIYGPPGSGKTTLTFFAIAEAQKDPDAQCVFIDCEDSFDRHNIEYIQNCGVDLERLIVIPISIAEKIFDIIKKLLESDTPPTLIVVDSIAAMMPMEDIEKTIETPTMATRARVLSRGLGVVNSVNKKTALIFINQIRSSLDTYGNPTTTPGGFAVKHYMALRIEVKMGEPIVVNKARVGHVLKYKAAKSKVGVPYRTGSNRFLYYIEGQKGGIDRIEEAMTIGLINEIITRQGAWYEFEGNRVMGKEGLYEILEKDSKLLEKLNKKIMS